MTKTAIKFRPGQLPPAPSLQPTYLLGHGSHELARLARQARRLEPFTREVLLRAGLRPGMRVLDVGCGVGDVSLLAAEIVGPTGTVLGVDRSEEALWTARRRAIQDGRRNVTFAKAGLNDVVVHPPVDAVIGRLVLMYQRDPLASLESLRANVKRGGLMIFHEGDLLAGLESFPPCPLFDRTASWVRESFERAGHDLRMGLRLPHLLSRVGLQGVRAHWASLMEVGDVRSACEWLADAASSVTEGMLRVGLHAPAELTRPELVERLERELATAQAGVTWPSMVGAWGTKP